MKNVNPKYIFILLFYFISWISNCQVDSINKLNSKGQKNGYWIIYLDENANPVSNIDSSYFYGFDFWVNGKKVIAFKKHKVVFSKLTRPELLFQKGRPQAINGTWYWYDQNGLLLNEEKYSNGLPYFFKSYFWDTFNSSISVFNEVLYFYKRYNNIPGTYYYEELGLNGKVRLKCWYRNGWLGWKAYKIKS